MRRLVVWAWRVLKVAADLELQCELFAFICATQEEFFLLVAQCNAVFMFVRSQGGLVRDNELASL